MTNDQFQSEIETKLIPVLVSEYRKMNVDFSYNLHRPDEYRFLVRAPRPMANGMIGFQVQTYSVWYVGDKIDWCNGELPQYAPKDI